MTHETITLATGETLIVERSTLPGGSHELWLREIMDGQPGLRLARVTKSHGRNAPIWSLAYITLTVSTIFRDEVDRTVKLLHAAAALAQELDEQFPAGAEVQP